jgi:hypothetical protein
MLLCVGFVGFPQFERRFRELEPVEQAALVSRAGADLNVD